MYQQKELKTVNLLNYNMFEIKWHVTNWCNYKCPYCIQGDEHLGFTPEDVVIRRAQNLNKILKEKNMWGSLQLLGGEVCFYNWTKILTNIPLVKRIFMTTNFSNELDYFKSLYEYCDTHAIEYSLLCSYHEVGDSFFEKILELAKWCQSKAYKLPDISFVVDNNFDFSIFDKFPEIVNLGLDFCMKINRDGSVVSPDTHVTTEISRIKALPKTWWKYYTKHKACQPAFLFEVGKDILKCRSSEFFMKIENGYIVPKNFYCDAGINSIAVTPNGSITRCDNNSDIIGNSDNYSGLQLASSKCQSSTCFLCQPVRMIKEKESFFDPFICKEE